MLICESCGNQDKFRQKHYGSKSYSEEAILDGSKKSDDNVKDWDNYEDGDSDEEGTEEIVCDDCDGEEVFESDNPKEIEDVMMKHTKANGEWSEEELESEEQSITARSKRVFWKIKAKIVGDVSNLSDSEIEEIKKVVGQ